jgi:hypothetical protein
MRFFSNCKSLKKEAGNPKKSILKGSGLSGRVGEGGCEFCAEEHAFHFQAVPNNQMMGVRIITSGRLQAIFQNGDMGTGWALAF